MLKNIRFLWVVLVAALLLTACVNDRQPANLVGEEPEEPTETDSLQLQPVDTIPCFDYLREKGVLTAVTNCSEINYNMYNGHPSGFEFELLKDFCDFYDLKLEIVVNDNMDSCFCLLDADEVDIVATGVGLNKRLKQKYFLTNPIFTQKSVLVQRMPRGWGKMSTENEVENQLLRSPLELSRKTVYVTKGLHTADVVEHLSEEIGDTIYVVESDSLSPIDLIRMVNDSLIDYAVVDEYIAKMIAYNMNGLDTKLAVSIEQPIGWLVKRHENDSSLLNAINEWIDDAEQKHLRKIMLRYIKNGRYVSSRREESNRRLSSFDSSIKKTAKQIGWDWRLLAALIYQESRFKVDLESDKGAFGLMQLMPSVMSRYGIDYNSSPQEQLEAGGKLIKYLDKCLKNKVVDSLERVKFVLAAYNAGLGHVYDAQRLAKKFGKAPDVWEDNVDYYILNKSKFLNDTCCKSGYLRGGQTYRFVEEIMDRFYHYQALMD